MKFSPRDRFVYDRLVELKQMLRQGDYPDCKGICGFIHLHTKNMDHSNRMIIDDAINAMKDIMSNWEGCSDSWEYPVPVSEEETSAEDAENIFSHLDEYEHWVGTDYSVRRLQLLDFTINQYIEWIAKDADKSN